MRRKYTEREILAIVRAGHAEDITMTGNISEPYTILGTSHGVNGTNGALLRGDSGKLYAITELTSTLDLMG